MGTGGTSPIPVAAQSAPRQPTTDQELAKLLVKLVLRTRAAIAKQYETDRFPAWDRLYKYALAKNAVLPAAVADQVFQAVPDLTGARAWVKMVVDSPRNPNNKGDETAMQLLGELRREAKAVERQTKDAYYYAEPIRAKVWCLRCHGEPKGEPDPMFPKYTKDGWKDGEIVGAVVARVAPKK
jgi:methyl-accepting chemotaxis protein